MAGVPQSRSVRAEGLELHARWCRGRGPAVVCVHGAGVSSRYMLPTMSELGGEFELWAPDLPGFGLSDKPAAALPVPALSDALAAFLDAAGPERPALLANSFGCQVAVDCAARHPKRIAALVLVGPTVDPAARTPPGQLGRWLRNGLREPPTLVPVIARDYRDAGMRRVLASFRYALLDRPEDKLPLVDAPTLVVRGERDRLVPQSWAEEVVRLLPRGRLALLPEAAHTANFSAPSALANTVRPFLAEVFR